MAISSLPPIRSRQSESLRVDPKTFEIIGTQSGTVYGRGSNLTDALAKQQQIKGGSTPSLAGRPDIFAAQPTQAEIDAGIQPIVPQAGMTPVAPRIASRGQIEALRAGTLPTPAREAAKPFDFAKAATDAVNAAKNKGREEMFADTSSRSFDNQLLIQQGLMYKQLFGERLTPEELRFLSPQQQALIRGADENKIKAELAGLNSIIAGRDKKRKEEQARIEKEEEKRMAKAETTFDIYNKIGFDKLSPEQRIQIETELGLPTGTLDDVIAKASEKPTSKFEYRATERGGFIEFELDPTTGQVLNQRTLIAPRGLVDKGIPPDEDEPEDVLSKDDFFSLAQEGIMAEGGGMMSPDISNPTVKAEIDRLYQEYLASLGGVIINGVSVTEEEAKKLLLTEDRRKMIFRGLNPNNIQDIKTYFETKDEELVPRDEESDIRNPFE